MLLPALMGYHLSLTFSTPNCTGQLKNICVLVLYFFIMKLCLQHHLSTVRGTQRCLGFKLRKGQQVWQKGTTHTKTHIQPPQLQQHEELIPLGKGRPHRNKSNLTIRTNN